MPLTGRGGSTPLGRTSKVLQTDRDVISSVASGGRSLTSRRSSSRTTIRTIHVPGHTADGCALLLEDRGLLFSGDALVTLDVARGPRGQPGRRSFADRTRTMRRGGWSRSRYSLPQRPAWSCPAMATRGPSGSRAVGDARHMYSADYSEKPVPQNPGPTKRFRRWATPGSIATISEPDRVPDRVAVACDPGLRPARSVAGGVGGVPAQAGDHGMPRHHPWTTVETRANRPRTATSSRDRALRTC